MTDALSLQQMAIVEFERDRLQTLQVDTTSLGDLTMMTHLIVLMELVDSKGIHGGLHKALAEYSDKFLDLAALAGEMMAAADGTRH